MSDLNPATHRGIYLLGNFEIEEKVSVENGWRPEYRTYVVSIGCGGADREERLLYEIVAKGYSGAQFKLLQDHVYFLRGALFPSNTPDTKADQLIFEGSDVAMIGPVEDFHGDLVDNVGVTGLGIVVEISSLVEACCQYMKKNPEQDSIVTTVFTVQHSDYHPIMKTARTYLVEYRVRPTPNLAKIAGYVKPGRECQFHGFIRDFNEETCCYVVVANKVHMTSGFVELPTKTSAKTGDADGSSKRPKKFKAKTQVSQSIAPMPDAANSMGPADTPLASGPFSMSSSGMSSSTVIGSGSSSLATPTDSAAPPPKKRGRYQSRRKATKHVDDDATEEI